MKNYTIRFAILLVGLILTHTAFADVKIKSRQTMRGQSSENTTYIKGKRMRAENNIGGMQTVNITQCDLKRTVRLMPQAQTFMIDQWQRTQSVAPTTATGQTQVVTKGGVITVTYTTKDTGERKQMFGYTAKHIITTMESVSSPDACSKNNSKMQFDGWYIDAAFVLNCENDQYVNGYQNQTKGGCQDRYEMKNVGTAKRGYPVLEKMTMFDETGKETYSVLNEVLELTNATLDAALFDVPSDYREVKDSTELYASMSSKSSSSSSNSSVSRIGGNTNSSNNSGMNSNIQNVSKSTSNISSEVGAKKAGVIRIGLANVKTGSIGEGMNAQELAGAINNTLGEYLKSPKIELVALEAKLASAIDAEAKEKECDYVIYAQVSHKKGGGGGMFGKMLGKVGEAVASQAYGSSNVAGAITSGTIQTAASVSGNVKSKDELILDVRVNSPGGAQALAKQFKHKAKSDGEDIISPVIEQAAQAILDAVAK
jgi:hypothetical protein